MGEAHLEPATTAEESAEDRLRARIRTMFSERVDEVSAEHMRAIEDRVLKLLQSYCLATNGDREMVYSEGEQELFETIRAEQLQSPSGSLVSGFGR